MTTSAPPAIVVDDAHLPRPHGRFLHDVLADAARQRLGTFTDGVFVPTPGREDMAAFYIEASLNMPAEALADALAEMRAG